MAIHCERNGFGTKTRAMRLASAGLKGRWSNREKAYIVSPTKAVKFERLFAAGWDACVMTERLEPPEES